MAKAADLGHGRMKGVATEVAEILGNPEEIGRSERLPSGRREGFAK